MICAKYTVHTPLGVDVIDLQKRDCEIYEECIKFAIQVCHKYRKGFDEFSIRKVIIPAYTKFSHCQSQFISKISQNYFRM